ncbi:ParB/RepB/Spo0J family partition protein [Virgibacillus ainsalahensis]
MNVKKVLIMDIKTEEPFRKKDLDVELAYDIKANGLKVPLIIEKQSDETFILVEGYRRYFALKHIGKTVVDCLIDTETSEIKHVIKRLKSEFYRKKRTGYELQRMIKYLLENDLDEVEIAKLCNVTKETVKNHMKGLNVNPDWLKVGERTGAGKHGYTIIHKTKHLKGENQQYIVDRYTERDINGEQVKEIKKVTEIAPFKEFTEDIQRKTLDDAINYMESKSEGTKEIVYEHSLRYKYKLSTHQFNFRLTNKLLERLINNFHSNFTNYLSTSQRNQLYNSLAILIERIGMPIKWTEFPYSHYKDENDEEKLNH